MYWFCGYTINTYCDMCSVFEILIFVCLFEHDELYNMVLIYIYIYNLSIGEYLLDLVVFLYIWMILCLDTILILAASKNIC